MPAVCPGDWSESHLIGPWVAWLRPASAKERDCKCCGAAWWRQVLLTRPDAEGRSRSLCSVSVWQRRVGTASLRRWARLPSVDAQACRHTRATHIPRATNILQTHAHTRQHMLHTDTCTHTPHTQTLLCKEAMPRDESHFDGFSLHWGPEPRREESFQTIGIWWKISPLELLCTFCGLLGPLTTPGRALSWGGASALGPPEGLCACLWPRLPDAQFLKRASFQAACSSSGLWQLLFVAPTGPSLGRGSLWQFSAQW